jgi:hypothetical protein
MQKNAFGSFLQGPNHLLAMARLPSVLAEQLRAMRRWLHPAMALVSAGALVPHPATARRYTAKQFQTAAPTSVPCQNQYRLISLSSSAL